MTTLPTLAAHHLTGLARYDIIWTMQYLCIKGGYFDCDGISHSRGGSSRVEVLRYDGQAVVAQQPDARLQVWRGMAHRQGRVYGVEETTQECVSKTGTINLTSDLVLPVAHLLQKKLPATMQQAVMYYLCQFCHMFTACARASVAERPYAHFCWAESERTMSQDCCICHEREATNADGFFCDECAQHYKAVLIARVVLSEKEEIKL